MSSIDILNMVIGLVVGVISSWLFWYFLLLTKPKVSISPMAVYNEEDDTIGIRVINNSRRQAADIRVLLFLAEIHKPWVSTIRTIPLRKDYLFALGGKQNLGKFWVLPTSTIFGAQGGKELMGLLGKSTGGERRLVFTLSATDAISGSKIIQRVTYRLDDIKFGKFSAGAKFLVIEVTKSNKTLGKNKRTT
jgi:hypothetical protein